MSATVVRIHAVRGLPANRRSPRAMNSPRTEKMTVSVANPDGGIGAPETARLIPAAWPAVATTAVAPAARTVATAPVRRSDPTDGAAVVVAGAVV